MDYFVFENVDGIGVVSIVFNYDDGGVVSGVFWYFFDMSWLLKLIIF